MKTYLIAIGYFRDKPNELLLGNFPWNGFQRIYVKDSYQYDGSIENLGITSELDLVGLSGALERYTVYDSNSREYKKKSLVVIAKSSNYRGNIYFVTDGNVEPTWKSVIEIEKYIQNNGVALANAKIIDGEIKLIKGELTDVDFIQYQLEYRDYLKRIKSRRT